MLLRENVTINLLSKKIILNRYSSVDAVEIILRLWMGYTLISNSGVGIIIPLEDLGLPDHIFQIINGMWDTGFMMHLVKGVELVSGIMIVFNFYVPIALIGLIPVVVNIFGMHIFLFNSFFGNGLYMLLICMFLVFRHKEKFIPLFTRK